MSISLIVPLDCLRVSKATREREEMAGNFRSCWCNVDDPCAVSWIVTSRKAQQLSGYFRRAVGSIQRYCPFLRAHLGFQCLVGSYKRHWMGNDRLGSTSRVTTVVKVRQFSTVVISPNEMVRRFLRGGKIQEP